MKPPNSSFCLFSFSPIPGVRFQLSLCMSMEISHYADDSREGLELNRAGSDLGFNMPRFCDF
jgi:hypothetical protein